MNFRFTAGRVEIRLFQQFATSRVSTAVGLDLARMHLFVDGSAQGGRLSAGPLPAGRTTHSVHVIVDGAVITAIADNVTAMTEVTSPANATFDGVSVVVAAASSAGFGAAAVAVEAWLLNTTN